jgi:hypothetical protein
MSAEGVVVEVIKWIRESVRPVVVLLVVNALALFVPQGWFTYIGIADAVQKYRPLAVLFFVGSLVWLGTFPIESQFYHWKRKKYLIQLTEEERNVLKPFILNAKKTQSFAMNLATARHLVKAHVLTESPTTDIRGHIVFVIDSWVFAHLRKHPELIGIR